MVKMAGKDLRSRCMEEGNTKLLSEWDAERNKGLMPENVSAGSHQKVWWQCENGHTWQSEVRVRVRGAKCPYCSKRILWVGDNDLATVNPTLAAQWDTAKNGALRPSDVLAGSQQYVWWRCENGHSWRASVLSRIRGSGCPICSGKTAISGENDLLTLFPNLAAEWNAEHNGSLTPEMVTPGSHKRIWWKCSEGHVWKAVIYSRSGKDKCGCPVCAGKARHNVKYDLPEKDF